MHARMPNPALAVPGALKALAALSTSARHDELPATTALLVRLRASQINGCSVCVDMHARELKQLGDTDTRIFAVAAWRDTPFFNEAERAALALTEATTRIADREDPVTDAIWAEAAKHYDEQQLATLVMHIAQINLWNRINVATRAIALGRAWTPDDLKAAG